MTMLARGVVHRLGHSPSPKVLLFFLMLSLGSHRFLCVTRIREARKYLWTRGCHKPGIPKCDSWAYSNSITWRPGRPAHLHSLAHIYWAKLRVEPSSTSQQALRACLMLTSDGHHTFLDIKKRPWSHLLFLMVPSQQT